MTTNRVFVSKKPEYEEIAKKLSLQFPELEFYTYRDGYHIKFGLKGKKKSKIPFFSKTKLKIYEIAHPDYSNWLYFDLLGDYDTTENKEKIASILIS